MPAKSCFGINPDSYRDGCAFFVTFFAQAKKVDSGQVRRTLRRSHLTFGATNSNTGEQRIGELVNSSNPRHGSFNFFNKPGIDLFVHNYSFLIYADKMN
jgi:hypothetical protein